MTHIRGEESMGKLEGKVALVTGGHWKKYHCGQR